MAQDRVDKPTIIDATNAVLGRLAAVVAKRLLLGERIEIVNAEKAVVIGNKDDILARYLAKKQRGDRYKGPFFPKMPHLIVKRTIRGMLPWKKARGKEAFKRLKVHIGVPKELEGRDFEVIEEAALANRGTSRFITVEEIARYLGWRG